MKYTEIGHQVRGVRIVLENDALAPVKPELQEDL